MSMKRYTRIIILILSILLGGCTADLLYSRGSQLLQIHVKPTTQPAEKSSNATPDVAQL
jgi:hypothetical protein